MAVDTSHDGAGGSERDANATESIGYASPQLAASLVGQNTNPHAKAALACGILIVLPVLGLINGILAIIFGGLGIQRANRGAPGRKTAFWGLVLGIVGVAVWPVLLVLPLKGRPRPAAQRIMCASNLRQIGTAMFMYANENHALYPDRIEDLMVEDISTGVFVCPASSDTDAAPGPTTRQTESNIVAGGHLSYIYLGKGKDNMASADTVLAYEPLSNHGGSSGANALFGDGHVAWLPANIVKTMILQVNSGQNPPPATKGY